MDTPVLEWDGRHEGGGRGKEGRARDEEEKRRQKHRG